MLPLFLRFLSILELKKEIPLHIKIRLFVLINLSTNKTMFAGKTAEKNGKKSAKRAYFGTRAKITSDEISQ